MAIRLPPGRALGLLLALLSPLVSGAPAGAGSPDDEVERLAHAYLQRWLAESPPAATALGLRRTDYRLPLLTAETLADRLAWTRGRQAELAAIPKEQLAPSRAADCELLEGRLALDTLEIGWLRRSETDPAFYLSLVLESLDGILERSSLSSCERVRAATAHLASIPEFLRAARVGLRTPGTLQAEASLELLERTLDFCRGTVPARAGACRVTALQADLAEADTTAVRALEDFGRAIREEMLPGAHSEFSIGRQVLERQAALWSSGTDSLESVLRRAQAELAQHLALLDSTAHTLSAASPWTVVDSLEQVDVPAAQRMAFVRSSLDHAKHYVHDHQFLTAPDPDVLSVREWPTTRTGPGCVELYVPGPWEPKVVEPWLRLRTQEAGCARELGRLTAPVAMLDEVVPGRLYFRLLARRAGSRLRQGLPRAAGAAGWGRYVTRAMIEHGFTRHEAGYQLAFLSRVCRQRALLVAEIGLHSGTMSLEDATAWLADRAHLDPAQARERAREAALHPREMEITLVEWELVDLRAEIERRLGPRFRLKAFHDAVLSRGAFPPRARAGAVRRELGLTN